MKNLLLILACVGIAACETTLVDRSSDEPQPLPPYPPGYERTNGRVPDAILPFLPEDVVPEQVLIADDGCFFYHRGATTFPITNGTQRLCLEREPVGTPIDLSAPLVIEVEGGTG